MPEKIEWIDSYLAAISQAKLLRESFKRQEHELREFLKEDSEYSLDEMTSDVSRTLERYDEYLRQRLGEAMFKFRIENPKIHLRVVPGNPVKGK